MRKVTTIAIATFVIIVAAWLSRPAAQVPSLGSNVTILRDKWGVPHVFQNDPALSAQENDERGAFAIGYAMAEDRLFQMEIFRRAGKGRLAELIGDAPALGLSAIDFDIMARRELYTEPEREDLFNRLSDVDKGFLKAFVDGVNLYIAEALVDPIHKLPGEYVALGILPAPWTVTDSIGFAALAIGIYGTNGGGEVQNAKLLMDLMGRLGPERGKSAFDDLFWVEDPNAPVTINQGSFADPNLASMTRFAPSQMALLSTAKIAAAIRNAAAQQHEEHALIDELGRRLGLGALFGSGHSNALVIGAAHTTTGHPMLGGGPQVGYATPSFFWESGLHTATYDSVGITAPLGPGNIMGRTNELAYTVTSGFDDLIDTYVETLADDDYHLYRYNGQWLHMDCRTETFLVRTQPTNIPSALQSDPQGFLGLDPADPLRPKPPLRPVVQELCRTIHGPVFFIDAANHVAFSHRKSHWGLEVQAAASWLRLGQKHSISEVDAELTGFPMTFNFHYASNEDGGHIAYFHRGKVPIRPAGIDPRLPLPGDGSAEWTGFIADAEMPKIIDPDQGFITNWNNKPIRGWAEAGEQRELWGPRHRMEGLAREVERIVAAGGTVSLNEGGSLDGTTSAACFAQRDFAVGSDPLGCVSSVNGIVRKAAVSDIHALTVLPFLGAALGLVSHGPAEDAAYQAMKTWSDAGGPLLRPAPSATTYDYPGIAIYRAWRTELQHELFDPVLGAANRSTDYPLVIDGGMEDDHGNYLTPDGLLYHVLTHAPELAGVEPVTAIAAQAGYCSAPTGPSCAEVLVASLTQTIASLTQRFGSADPSKWLEPVIVSTVPAQGAAPEITIERMNRGSWNQLHDFGTGADFRTFNVVPPGNSGFIDLATLVQSQVASDPRAAVSAGNPHVFDQVDLYQGWRYKHFVQHESDLESPTTETVPYLRGVVPQPDPTLLRGIWRIIDQAGIPLPNFTLLGEVSTE
jgi:acyl-homoserine lactone acylase PvdQ